jgi:hypothetical protein
MFKKILAVSLIAMTGSAFACCNSELKYPDEAVKVVGPTVTTSKTDGPLLVTVLGTFQNTTEHPVSELVVEAKLIDSTGKTVDVLTQPVYGIVVPAGHQVAFRMQAPAAAKESAYASVQARVTSGESHLPSQPRAEQKDENPYIAFLVSWGPMLLLIAVWIFWARKYSGKGSPQHRSLDLIAEQNVMLAKQLTAIESIALSARASQPRGEA